MFSVSLNSEKWWPLPAGCLCVVSGLLLTFPKILAAVFSQFYYFSLFKKTSAVSAFLTGP